MLATIFLMISSKASAGMSLPYYVCSSYSDTQTTDYYGYGRDHSFHFPTQWSLVDQVGHCTGECWPCESYHLRHREMMIGYGGTCTISYENQIALGLYNVTTEYRGREKSMETRLIRLHDTVNPFELSGVFESRSPHFFIKKYSLCIYPIQRFFADDPVENKIENVKEFGIPTRPANSAMDPTRPVETTRPVESTKTPIRPVESAMAPTRPVESVTPIRPVESTKTPIRPVESTKTPIRPVEVTRPVESAMAPTRPVEVTRPVESTITPTRQVEPASQSEFLSETLAIILVSLLGVVIVLLMILIFCKKEKVASNLPSDIQHYIDKHNDMVVLRFDQDCPEKVVYPKEINTPKYIEYKDLESHIAVSWSTLHHLYMAVKTNWKSVINDIGMKTYIEKGDNRPLTIYKAFRIADEIMTPDKTYVLTKVVLSNEQPDLMAFVVEEKLVYFRQKFILVVHKDRLNHISVKTNLPEYHIFQHFSYKTFEAFTEHSIHDKILIASRHKKEYDEINLSEVENGMCNLRRVATLTTQNKKSLEYVKEIEAIKHGLENTTFKLSY